MMKSTQTLPLFSIKIKDIKGCCLLLLISLLSESGWAQIPGSVCEDPIVISALPFSTTDNTATYGDDYDFLDFPILSPNAIGTPLGAYLRGDDIVYSYTPTTDGMIDLRVSDHSAWTGLFIFTGCPFASTVGGHTISSATIDLKVEQMSVSASVTYYIVISTFFPPQSTEYTLTIFETIFDCPDIQVNVGEACNDNDETTYSDVYGENCECAGTSYDCPDLFANTGDVCDDGDASTLNDVLIEDCSCAGITPADGVICYNPIQIPSLPYLTTDNTENYGDNYDSPDYPGFADDTIANPPSNYLKGDDVVYAYTSSTDKFIDVLVSEHGIYAGVFVFTGCPFDTTFGLSTNPSDAVDLRIDSLPVQAGITYYIVISTFGWPEMTPYTLSVKESGIECPDLAANIGDTCDDEDNSTINDAINEDCICAGIIPPDGMECSNAIPINSLPYITTDNTEFYFDNYDPSDLPEFSNNAIGNPSANYLGGNDVVYSYTPSAHGFIDINVTNHGAWTGIFVFKSCPFWRTLGGHTNSSDTTDLKVEQFPVEAYETYYIVISTYPAPQTTDYTLSIKQTVYDCPSLTANFGDACNDYNEFTINDEITEECLCTGTIPPDGTICQAPIEITSLPYNTSDSTDIYSDNYDPSDFPMLAEGVIGNPSAYYLNGNDVVYSYTPSEDGHIDIDVIDHSTWAGVFIFKGCSFWETVGGQTHSWDTISLKVEQVPVLSGVTYYIVISTFAAPQTTPYTLSITETVFDCPMLEANIGGVCDDGDETTINDVVSENCECVELPPAPGSFCSTAIPVDCGAEPATYSSNASVASDSVPCSIGNKGLWFSFTGTGYEIILKSTADFDHGMSLNYGSCDDLSYVNCRDHGNGVGVAETYTFSSTVLGRMYYVYVAHYSSTSNVTGNITIEIDCAERPACEPDLTLTVQDADGNAIDACNTDVDEFFVLAVLSNGEGNNSYSVIANNADPVEVSQNESLVFGPYSVGTNVFINALGDLGEECSASGSIICIPLNDDCANATVVDIGEEGVIGDKTLATPDGPPMFCAYYNDPIQADIWYSFVAPANGNLTIETYNTEGSYNADTQIQVLDGCNGNILGCNDDTGSELLSKIVLACGEYTSGETYLIQVDGFSGDNRPFRLTVTADDENCAPFDCPEINAHFGDACDDGNTNTINDVVSNNCECIGIPDPNLYCEILESFIGDNCDDGDENTTDDIISADCECIGTPLPECANNQMAPTILVNLDTPDTITIGTCQKFRQYSVLTGINAEFNYEFSGVENGSEANLAFITVRSDSVNGPILDSGWSPLIVTSVSNADIFVHWNADEQCETSNNCATTQAICVTCATIEDCDGVPGGSAYEGYPCDDGDPTTYNDKYVEDCECVGTSYDCVDLIANIGDACDDNNPLSTYDAVNENCECIGEIGFSCANSIPVECNADPVTLSTTNSNAVVINEFQYCSVGTEGLYFSFLGTGNDMVIHSTATFYHGIAVGHGSCESLIGEGCTSGGHNITKVVTSTIPGETYYLYVAYHSYYGYSSGDITIEIDCYPFPENNACESAVPLTCGVEVEGTTLGATVTGPDFGACANYLPNPDVFYSLDVVQGREYTVFTNGISSGDMILIYSGTCNELVEEYCSEQVPYQEINNSITFTADETETLIIRTYFHSYYGIDFTITASCVGGEFDCPELEGNIGDNCDDGNPVTENDKIDENCECHGDAGFTGNTNLSASCNGREATLYLYQAGTEDLLGTYETTVGESGDFTIVGLDPGAFDMILHVNGCLRKGMDNITIAEGGYAEFGTIITGDLSNDNFINISDLSMMITFFGSVDGDSNYNPLADVDCNGFVNITDLSFLLISFGSSGD